MACTIARAPAIAVGHFVSYHDTTVARGLGSGIGRFAIGRFRADRWLRGRIAGREFRVVQFEDEQEDGPRPRVDEVGRAGPELASPPGRVIICFEDLLALLVAPKATFLGAAESVSRWGIDPAEPPYYAPGAMTWTPERESEVRLELSRQRPDSLLARADVVAIVQPRMPLRGNSMRVTTALLGTSDGAELHLRLALEFMAEIRKGCDYLLVLRSARDGVFEPVSLRAGVVALDGTRVPAWNCTLEEVRARIARIESRPAE